jgi:glycosyltransferase involved in cell wall biosynthesis
MYDCASSHRVEKYIANSRYVANRILQYWRRQAEVIYPPVDLSRFTVTPENDGYYLWLGKVVRYKKPDLAVQAFNQNGRNLVVLGDGEQLGVVKRIAQKNIIFLGAVDDNTVTHYLQRCRALIFSGIEDFGIVPVEAMACGKPVIALGQGGVTESVIEDRTGIFFRESTPESLNEAIERFESMDGNFNPAEIRRQAERFSETVFMDRIWNAVTSAWYSKFGTNLPIENGVKSTSADLKAV